MMATKNSPLALEAATVNSEAVTVMATPGINAATPDNTPVPGGGSWVWDYSLACWVGWPRQQSTAINLNQPE